MIVVPEDTLEQFEAFPPARLDEIHVAEDGLGKILPEDYKAFLLRHGGGEGFIGRHYLILWRVTELVGLNEGYEVDAYAPGLIIFGSSGGGDAFAFDTRTTPYIVTQVPFVGMSLEDSRRVATSFNELLQRMSEISGPLF